MKKVIGFIFGLVLSILTFMVMATVACGIMSGGLVA